MTAETTPDHAFRTELTASGIVRLTWRSGLCITDQLAAQAMAADRSYRPHHSPTRIAVETEALSAICVAAALSRSTAHNGRGMPSGQFGPRADIQFTIDARQG